MKTGKTNIKEGDKFGKLTAIKYLYTKDLKYKDSKRGIRVKKNKYWLWKCDCGNEKEILVDSVVYGKNTFSCGCLQIETQNKPRRILPIIETTKYKLLRHYITSAGDRAHEFNLSESEFFWLTKQDCYYCGKKPTQMVDSQYPKET